MAREASVAERDTDDHRKEELKLVRHRDEHESIPEHHLASKRGRVRHMVHPRASLEGGGLGVHLDTAEPLEELRNARKQKRPNDREGVLDRRVEHPILKEPHDANIWAELEAAHVHRRAAAIAEGHTLIGRHLVVYDARGVRRRRLAV